MKRVLVLGATGAMGKPLVEILSKNPEIIVYASSRKDHRDPIIHWLKGNGKNIEWLKRTLCDTQYDAIVDFMNYNTAEFQERYQFILSHTSHYIFVSSARVYDKCDGIINESSPRILDVCKDQEYLSNDTYELAKAREEDILNHSNYPNYTIIRPSLTYNYDRLQLTIFEKDEWLYRIFDGNSIIFPQEMKNVYTTMTYGGDVAHAVSKMILNKNTYRETFNVCSKESRTWGDIYDTYRKAIEKHLDVKSKLACVNNVEKIAKDLNRYTQYALARGINRRFSNNKLESTIGEYSWISIDNGLMNCIEDFFRCGANIHYPSPRMAAYLDRLVHEYTPLKRFDTTKQKLGYLLCRAGVNI